MSIRDNKSSLRPRSFAYARRDFGVPDSRVGIHVIKKLPGVAYVRPSWSATETVIRIFPGVDSNDMTKFEPTWVSEEQGRYGNWQCCYEAVRKFGDPGITMLLSDGSNPHYNAYMQNPCWILFRAIKDACDKGQGKPEWFPLLNSVDKRSAALTRPTEIVLVQGAVVRHDSKDQFSDERLPYGCNPQDPTVVFELTKALAAELFSQIDEVTSTDPKGDGFTRRHGDPVSIEDGVFIHIYEKGTDPNPKLNNRAPVAASGSGWASKGGGSRGKGGKSAFGYDLHLTKTLDGGPGDLPATLLGSENMVRTKWRPWEDILEFMTDEQQAHLINPLFPASAIMYAFRDKKDWILEDTRRSAVGAVSVSMSAPTTPMAQAASWTPPAAMPQPTAEELIKLLQNNPALAAQLSNVQKVEKVNQTPPSTSASDCAVPNIDIPESANVATATGVKASSASALEEARARAAARSRINSQQ